MHEVLEYVKYKYLFNNINSRGPVLSTTQEKLHNILVCLCIDLLLVVKTVVIMQTFTEMVETRLGSDFMKRLLCGKWV